MIDRIEINAKAVELRKQLGEDENSYIDIFALATQIKDLTLMLYPMGDNISGICIKNEGANLIAINSEMSYGRQRYSLAHELYHLFYDSSDGISISAKSFEDKNENEIIADWFASYFLAPYNALRFAIQKKNTNQLTMRDIISLEQSFGISHQAMLFRLFQEGYINRVTTMRMPRIIFLNLHKLEQYLQIICLMVVLKDIHTTVLSGNMFCRVVQAIGQQAVRLPPLQ